MDARKYLIIDAVALVLYLVVANPVLIGIVVHEWLALGLFVVVIVHVAMHVDWAIETAKSARSGPSWARTGNLVLDALVLVVFATVTVSGLMVSGAVLQAFGWYAPGYYFWDPLHAVSAKVLLALLLVHVVVHGKWLVSFFKGAKGKSDGV